MGKNGVLGIKNVDDVSNIITDTNWVSKEYIDGHGGCPLSCNGF